MFNWTKLSIKYINPGKVFNSFPFKFNECKLITEKKSVGNCLMLLFEQSISINFGHELNPRMLLSLLYDIFIFSKFGICLNIIYSCN